MEILSNIFVLVFIAALIAAVVFYRQKRKGKDIGRKLLISAIVAVASFLLVGVTASQSNSNSNIKTASTSSSSSSKKSELSLTITSNQNKATGNDSGKLNYVLKGRVNKDNSTIEIQGDNVTTSDTLVTKKVSKGNFKINVPLSIDDNTDHIKLKVTFKKKGYGHGDVVVTVQNGSNSYKAIKSSISASEKASSESSSIAESNSIASSEAASSSAEAASEAASSSAAAASEAAAASQKAYEKSPASYQTGITYDQLARTPDQYEDQKVAFTGKIVQVIEDTSSTEIRLAVNGNYDNIILVYIPSKVLGSSRVLEDDLISIYGISKGTVSYESTMGGKITVPAMKAKIIDDKGTASDDYGY